MTDGARVMSDLSLAGAPQYLDVAHLSPTDRALAFLDSPWVTDSIMEAGILLATGPDDEYRAAVDTYLTDPSTWSCLCKGRQYRSACRHLVAANLRVLGVESGDLDIDIRR